MERPLLRLCREILFRETDLLLRVRIRHIMNKIYKSGVDDPTIPTRLRRDVGMVKSAKLKAKLLHWLEAMDEGSKFHVRGIMGLRLADDNGRMYLVRWKGYGSEEDSWEPAHQLIEDGCSDLIARFHKDHMKFF
jgi:hypothetical protein